jgi:hypothetical protein
LCSISKELKLTRAATVERSAEKGHVGAMFVLGALKIGVALHWLRMAAERGHGEA